MQRAIHLMCGCGRLSSSTAFEVHSHSPLPCKNRRSQPKVLRSSPFVVCLTLLLQSGKSDHHPESIQWYPVLKLYSSHDDGRHEVIWTRHDWLAMEQDTRIIQFKNIGLVAELWRVVDVYSVLDERFVTAGITWFTGIDRYLKEGATSAT